MHGCMVCIHHFQSVTKCTVTAQDAWGQGLLALQRLRNLSARAVTQDDENALPLLDTWDADAMGRILDIF